MRRRGNRGCRTPRLFEDYCQDGDEFSADNEHMKVGATARHRVTAVSTFPVQLPPAKKPKAQSPPSSEKKPQALYAGSCLQALLEPGRRSDHHAQPQKNITALQTLLCSQGIIEGNHQQVPHISIVYGFDATAKSLSPHVRADLNDARQVRHIGVKLADVAYWDTPERSIAYFSLAHESEQQLLQLHQRLVANGRVPSTRYDYRPHTTIGFLKPGERLPTHDKAVASLIRSALRGHYAIAIDLSDASGTSVDIATFRRRAPK